MSYASQGIYRRVSVRMWGDSKFSRLSRIRPSGQALWVYLLTGPHTTAVPGVFVAGRAAMAEALGWAQRDFDAAAAEVRDAGMAFYDPKTHLWFLPRGLAHNPPANPNVVRSWRTQLALLPECALLERVLRELRVELSKESTAWVQAFDEALGLQPRMASPNPSGKPSPKPLVDPSPIQEQEQEQEQDAETAPSLRSGGSRSAATRAQQSPAVSALSEAPSASRVQPTPGCQSHSKKAKAKASGIPPCPYQDIVALYHEILSELPGVRVIDAGRERAMRRVWIWCLTSIKENGERRATNADEALAWFRFFFNLVRSSDWLMGRTKRSPGHENWECSLDYLLSPKGHKYVIERL